MAEQRDPWGPQGVRPPEAQPPIGGPPYSYPGGEQALRWATEGALTRRFIAYLFDLFFIGVIWLIVAFAISVVGLITFGLGWVLFGILPFIGIIYSAVTVGGPGQGTYGMRIMGLRAVDSVTGGQVDLVMAAAHSLLFYVAVTTFLLWLADVFIGLARSDRRLGHDLLTGIVLVRR